MRILVVTGVYPRPGRPTLGSFHRLQCEAFAAAGHAVTVVAPVAWSEAGRDWWEGRRGPTRYETDGGVRVVHPTYFYTPKVLRARYGRFYEASVAGTFRREARALRPDVVLAYFAHPDGWAAVRLARRAGLPVVVKVIGSDVLVSGREGNGRRPFVAEAVCGADGVVAVSRDLADHVVALGADPDRVHVVHEGLDTTLFRPADRAEARARLGLPAAGRMVLFVGNLLLSKGAGVLVEACAGLAASGLDFSCHFVGQGRDGAGVRALAARLGLDGRTAFHGPRAHAELADWYAACNVLALPSFSEGIPNVLREASACGRPYVATRVGGVAEITGPRSGLLVEPGNPTALADALRAVLDGSRPDLDGEPGVPPLTWDESARRVAAHLQEAVTFHAGGSRDRQNSTRQRPDLSGGRRGALR